MSKLEQFISARNEYNKLVKNDFDEIITELGSSLKVQFPTLEAFAFLGYTPGWNDGETCEHKSYAFVHELDEYSDIVELLNVNEELEEYNSELSSNDEKKIVKILEEFNTFVEHKYGTNFIVVVDVRSEVIVTSDDYDCGY